MLLLNSQTRRRGIDGILVLCGTFAAPLAQWAVFFFVARVGGSGDAGHFALLFAVVTPVITGTNWGLRNGFITLQKRTSFADFVLLRFVGIVVASLIILTFGFLAGISFGMVVAMTLMKGADSISDLWFGRWQYQERLRPFGYLMIINGLVSVSCAATFAWLGFGSGWIVLGSAFGSIVTAVLAVLLDYRDVIAWRARGGYERHGALKRCGRILRDCSKICAAQVLAGAVVNVPTWSVAVTGSAQDIGRFAAAGYMISVGSLLGASLNSTVLGRYHSEMVSGGSDVVRRSVLRGTAAISFVGVAGVIAVWFFGVGLFTAVYGAGFAFTPTELCLIALAAALNPGTYLMNAALLAVNLYTAQLAVVAVALAGSAGVAVVGTLLGAPGFMLGAYTALVGSLLKFGMSGICLRRSATEAVV